MASSPLADAAEALNELGVLAQADGYAKFAAVVGVDKALERTADVLRRCRTFAAVAAARMVDPDYRRKMKEMESRLSQMLEAWVSGRLTEEELRDGAQSVIQIIRTSAAEGP
jgi:hypothetical protein